MSAILQAWNSAESGLAVAQILPCCSSGTWANALVCARPLPSVADLLTTADAIWLGLGPEDWNEAFSSHPRIGEEKTPLVATKESADWSRQEQSAVAGSNQEIQAQLRRGNAAYEERFGRTYIVCATGKSAKQMLAILLSRLQNDDEQELREAVEQQRQITQLRLRKWLQL